MQRFQLFNSGAGVVSLQPALGQACDQCRSRKRRCSREHPCVQCERMSQTCSYDQAPKTRGRKVRRRTSARDIAEPGDNFHPHGTHIIQAPPIDDEDEDDDPPHVPDDTLADDELPASFGRPTLPAPEIMEEQQQILPLTPFTDPEWQGMTPLRQGISIDTQSVPTPGLQDPPWFDNDPKRPQLFSRKCFKPYIQLYFDRLYAVFPVIEKQSLLELINAPHLQAQPLPSTVYTFLTALSAAVIVQLNLSATDPSATDACGPPQQSSENGVVPSVLTPELLVAECLETRKCENFIEEADEWTILSSFFLFAYYGNCDNPRSAWYYLREAIGFAQSLGLDDPDMYYGSDLKICQRRRYLFWLLFVTERAYALQHRSQVMLHHSIDLPHVFDSSEPKLMYGFVTLARVFAAVDNAFITAWRNQNRPRLESALGPGDVHQALQEILKDDIQLGALALEEMNETQRLDIMVTQQWLKTLAWQLQSNLGITVPGGTAVAQQVPAPSERMDSICVLEASKSLLGIIHTADTLSLEAHGIGMEQKVSDVANCLCDVIKARESEPALLCVDFFSTPDFLHSFMVFLAGFRNRESQYLQPLLCKASSSLSSFLQPQRPLLFEESFEDSEEPTTWAQSNQFMDGVF